MTQETREQKRQRLQAEKMKALAGAKEGQAGGQAVTSGLVPPVAPRPHRVTIWLGVLGPVLSLLTAGISATIAIVALGKNEQSIKLSEQSMKVGQRSYLSVQQSAVTMTDEMIRSGFKRFKTAGGRAEFTVGGAFTHIFTLVNDGNTPARIISVHLSYYLPDGWTFLIKGFPQNIPFTVDYPGVLAPKSHYVYHLPHSTNLTAEGAGVYLNNADGPASTLINTLGFGQLSSQIIISGSIVSRDVFDHEDSIVWCGATNSSFHYLDDCNAHLWEVVHSHPMNFN